MRSCGTSSTYRPPKEWLWPVVKFVNDILCVPPTLASSWWTLPVKPFGGNHLAIASGSRNARYTLSGAARSTRCRRMVFPGTAFLLSLVTSAYSLGRRVDKERQSGNRGYRRAYLSSPLILSLVRLGRCFLRV